MKLETNLNKVLDQIAKILSSREGYDRALRAVASTMLGEVQTRIFEEGRNASGTDIGQYKPGSYKNLRNRTGRRIDKVNLSFSGQLNTQMTVIDLGDGYGLGWPDNEKFERALILDKKYASVFKLTDDERARANDYAKEFLTF